MKMKLSGPTTTCAALLLPHLGSSFHMQSQSSHFFRPTTTSTTTSTNSQERQQPTNIKKRKFPSTATATATATSTVLQATIYGWNEEDDNDSLDPSAYSIFEDSTSSSSCPSEITTQTDALARLAAAYSQPTTPVSIDQITNVDIINIDGHHIDIGAVVCDDEACVNILTSVEFLHDCESISGSGNNSESGMEECMMDNFVELDRMAAAKLELDNLGNVSGGNGNGNNIEGEENLMDLSLDEFLSRARQR